MIKLATLLAALLAVAVPLPQASQATDLQKRAAERLAALQREAESLASQEQTLLVELRKLEVDREIKAAHLAEIERNAGDVQAQLAEAEDRARTLQKEADAERPEIEARLVQLYKLGRVGYWRLLLDVDNLRELGRAYRTAAALGRINRDRVEQYRRTIAALEVERGKLRQRATDLAQLRRRAADARAAVDRAVAARSALVKSIDQRRDLNAQWTGELEDARRRLQDQVSRMQPSAAPSVGLPIRPFQGALPWPADGVPLKRPAAGRSAAARNGVELSLPEGAPVKAVHEGTVAYADQFTGYGNLVIIDHGQRAFSLYGHLGSIDVHRGDRVQPGTVLGTSGRDPAGNPALYFELRIDGQSVDPLQWLKRP